MIKAMEYLNHNNPGACQLNLGSNGGISHKIKLEAAPIASLVDYNTSLMQRLRFLNRIELSTNIAK